MRTDGAYPAGDDVGKNFTQPADGIHVTFWTVATPRHSSGSTFPRLSPRLPSPRIRIVWTAPELNRASYLWRTFLGHSTFSISSASISHFALTCICLIVIFYFFGIYSDAYNIPAG